MRIPLHLSQTDYSKEADHKRVMLHIGMSQITGGKGFRQAGKNSRPTRVEQMATEVFGE